MINIVKIIVVSLLLGMMMLVSVPSEAQQSMKETEKLRMQEEKRRYKLRKNALKQEKKDKKADPVNKGKKVKNKGKNKVQLTKAAQGLSNEGLKVNRTRANSRKGSQKLTKAAKSQKKSENRRQKSLKRF